jgi:glycosyltransferase involved in cell wall biosynthesis
MRVDEPIEIETTSPSVVVGIVSDFVEEGWFSMDLVSDMLLENLSVMHDPLFTAQRIRPALRRRFGQLPLLKSRRIAFNADRLLNRMRDYPLYLRAMRLNSARSFNLYHIVDHSYAHLVHDLPAERTVVTCHDLDTFACLLEPDIEPRPKWFRKMTTRILTGLQKAARITCDSCAIRDQILHYQLLSPERLTVAPLGVHPTCTPEPNPIADRRINELLGAKQSDAIEILHVGSTIARKRIDVLLHVFGEIVKVFPHARLLRVGGAFMPEQEKLLEDFALGQNVYVLPSLTRAELAAVYRRAALVVQPSEREGFGLPVVEALACGTPVVASDLPVLREVGGEAVEYCAVAEIEAWCERIIALINEKRQRPEVWQARRQRCLGQAAKFSWASWAQQMKRIYREILNS